MSAAGVFSVYYYVCNVHTIPGPVVVVVAESAGDGRKIKDHTAAAVALSRIYIYIYILSLLLLHIVRPFPMRIVHETSYGIQGVQNARRRGMALEFRVRTTDGAETKKICRTNRVPGLREFQKNFLFPN